mmetsp:Transcript_2955/g.8792  ORF Transcript_2955/g.8792 Transcript_2955/m.8792 type:complete len:142 (-) Transcript_2955:261-686(-)
MPWVLVRIYACLVPSSGLVGRPLSDIAHGLHLVRPLATNTVSISKKALPNSIQLMCVQSLSRCHQSSPRIELDRTTSHIAIMANSLTVVWRAAHNENIAGMLCSPWLPEPARTHCEVRLATYLKRRLEAALQRCFETLFDS